MAYRLKSRKIRKELLVDKSSADSFGGEASEDEIDNVFEEAYTCIEWVGNT